MSQLVVWIVHPHFSVSASWEHLLMVGGLWCVPFINQVQNCLKCLIRWADPVLTSYLRYSTLPWCQLWRTLNSFFFLFKQWKLLIKFENFKKNSVQLRRKGSSFLQNGQGIFIKISLHVYFSCTFWQRVTACSKALYKISYLTWLLKVWNVPSTTILQTTVSTCLSSSAFWSPLFICFILFLRFSLASVVDKLRIQKFSGMNLDLVYFATNQKQNWSNRDFLTRIFPLQGKFDSSLALFDVFMFSDW